MWVSGQLGAQLQEYVTRDLRNALYSHLQRLPLGFFMRTKTGDILARVLNDTQQTKQVITQAVTQSLQSAAVVHRRRSSLLVRSRGASRCSRSSSRHSSSALLQPLLRKLRKGTAG